MTASTRRAPLLMTPGPTRVPERVLHAGAEAMIHHRSDEFSAAIVELNERMRPLLGTDRRVLLLPSTGRGGMESVIVSLFNPGDEIIVCANGRFGALWGKLAESFGLVVYRVATDWTKDINPAEVEAAFDAHPGVRAVALTYSDTSTGVANDVAGLARLAARRDALVLVDAVSAIGGMPFAFDAWGVDAVVTASQKCLMSSPGLAMVTLSERALAAAKASRMPRHYLDLVELDQSLSKPKPFTTGTAPVHAVLQVVEALRMIHEEGVDAVFARHAAVAKHVWAGLARLGLSFQCPGLTRRSTTLTAIAAPAHVPPKILRDGVLAHGVLVAEGLGPYDATGFRIGHMGDIRQADVDVTLDALAQVLAAHPVPAVR